MYSLLLETQIKDSKEKHRLFNAIENIPCMNRSSGVVNTVGRAFTGNMYVFVVYSLLQKQLHWQKVHHIVGEAVEIETKFVCEALPFALISTDATLMSEYIKFVSDCLLVALSYQKKNNVETPFDWMEFISLKRV
ncbi:hypothetical protein POTOM_037351 [Populus tomentosa]|uniref:Uncharacterized protein n=1 Tax=Populus tomentosa TaxID=118781 RepID=A0A8X7YVN2_POPTO|nr:hypothetical protein POTOM_037351 [Populus tomentosa]